MDLTPPCPTAPPTAPQLADLLVDFLEAAFHEVLCVRRVYPAATFRRVRRFGQLCWWSQSAALSAYLRDVCASVKEALQRHLVHRLLIVLLDEENRECERYIFELAPLYKPPTVAASTPVGGWPGRVENHPLSAAAAQHSFSDTSKSYGVSGKREDGSRYSGTSAINWNSGVTCSNVPAGGAGSDKSSSTSVVYGSCESSTGEGNPAWRRLTAAFQDALTKLELVGCWLDVDDTDDQADDHSEDSSSEENGEDSSGASGGIKKVASHRSVAARHPAAPLPCARTFRVQLQQDAEVLQFIDTSPAAVSRPLSCFDEDLRAMLLLQSRWLPSATSDTSWGLPNRERQQNSFQQFVAADTFRAPSGDSTGQRSNTGKGDRDFRRPCSFSKKSSDARKGGVTCHNFVEDTPLFDSFVLASVPRSMIFAWEPRTRSGRAASPVLAGIQQSGRTGATLLRIIVQQSRRGLRSSRSQQQRGKRSLSSLSKYTTQSETRSAAAAEDPATIICESKRRKKKTTSESLSIIDSQEGGDERLLQRARYESQPSGERQVGTGQPERECIEEKHQRAVHVQVAQQLAKGLKRYRTGLQEEVDSIRSRTEEGSAVQSREEKSPHHPDRPSVDVISVSSMDSLLASQATFATVPDAAEKTSAPGAASVGAETPELRAAVSSEDKLPAEFEDDSGTSLLFDAHLDNLF